MEKNHESKIAEERVAWAAVSGWWASNNVWNERGGIRPYPADLLDDPDRPDCLRGFSREEVERGSELLVRLGLLERPSGDRAHVPRPR